jgi:DNA-binding helix-hairpin-helix protein with protein kinase domain
MSKQTAFLAPGRELTALYSRKPVIVDDLLGGGGQGQVFRVRFDGGLFALKWYHTAYLPMDPTLRERLEKSIEAGPPNNQFWWPFELATAPREPSFGYIMPLREQGFETLLDYRWGRVKSSFPPIILASFHLADSFLRLHSKGLCYKDISFGNVFFQPQSGEIRICDIDNVDVNGRPGAIMGTHGFIAPEVLRGEGAPSTQTDLHSLAVMLFQLLMKADPLDGQRGVGPFDEAMRLRLYGMDPLFIFDPEDGSNAPIPGEQDSVITAWAVYPQYIRDLFTRAFTVGLRDPLNGRVRESEWREAMAHLYDSLFSCSCCGAVTFYDLQLLRQNGGKLNPCWGCGNCPELPPRLRFGTHVVVLANHSRLFCHHLSRQRGYDFENPLGEMVDSPRGLRNLSAEKWVLKDLNGSFMEVPPGGVAPLANGTKLFFGSAEGEVRM